MMNARSTMAAGNTASSSGRGRPRSEASHERILNAVVDMLHEGDLSSMSMAAIARRAGVSTATLYRWWPSKAALALNAFVHMTGPVAPPPDSGDLRADLRAHLRAVTRMMTYGDHGRILGGLVAAAQSDPELAAEMFERISAFRQGSACQRLRLAQRRGEMRADVDLDEVNDLLHGPLYFRLVFGYQSPSEEFADTIVDAVLAWCSTSKPRGKRPHAN